MKTAHVYHLRDIILGGFALLFSAATFAIALLGVDEVPASVRSEAQAGMPRLATTRRTPWIKTL